METQEYKPRLKRSPLYYVSPCILVALFALYGIVNAALFPDRSAKWGGFGSFLVFEAFVPILFVVVAMDVIVKLALTKKVLYVWLIEALFIIGLAFIYYRYSMFFR